MVMEILDKNAVHLPVSGKKIGYVKRWMNGSETWDGWLEWDGSVKDELIVNSDSRTWSIYQMIVAYQKRLIDDAKNERSICYKIECPTFEDLTQTILECGEFMNQTLKEYLAEINQKIRVQT